jgi:hypothetical protein
MAEGDDQPMSLRKRIGYLKWILFQGGWADHVYTKRLNQLSDEASRKATALSPVPVATAADVEVHMLCGHRHVPMAIWAWWSLLRFCAGKYAAVLHSDGSLTAADIARFQKAFPGIRVEPAQSTDEIFAGVGGKAAFPFLHQFREDLKLSRKIMDFHMLARGKVVIMLDSDILFFRHPTELFDAAEQCRTLGSGVAFNKDIGSMFSATPEILSAHYKRNVPECFNSGLVVLPRFDLEGLKTIEALVAAAEPSWRKNYFMEQTTLAVVSAALGAAPLPAKYRVADSEQSCRLDEGDLVCIHYAGKANRPRFFDFGIPKVAAGA